MTIKTIYKVDSRDEEYDTAQEAMVAEVLTTCSIYLESYKLKTLSKAITDKYFLIPHRDIEEKAVEVANPGFEEPTL